MVVELSRPVSRRVHIEGRGVYIVTIEPLGVRIRKLRRKHSVLVPYLALARAGLQSDGYNLTAKEWEDSLATLAKLARLRQV